MAEIIAFLLIKIAALSWQLLALRRRNESLWEQLIEAEHQLQGVRDTLENKVLHLEMHNSALKRELSRHVRPVAPKQFGQEAPRG